jgi:hypothetical protein
MWVWVRRASGSSGCVEYNESTCGRWSSVSESLPAYGAIGSAVGRGDGTPLNLGELRIPEMDFRLPPKNPTTLVVRSVKRISSFFNISLRVNPWVKLKWIYKFELIV